jgi:transposase
MITLTQRAEQHLIVLQTLDRGELLMAEAAALLGLSTRQVRRLRRAYRRHGPKALIHGNRGRPSPQRVATATRARIVHLAQTTYAGVNHTHLSELLADREGLVLSQPTIHRILRAAGLRSPRRRRPPRHRRRRERMARAGLLVQLDGSDHDWLQQRGPRLTLLAAIDDATGHVLAATFRDEEDTHGYFVVLRKLVQTKGIPVAVYSDHHSIFHRTAKRPLTLPEQLAGTPAPTRVARALHELGIRWIPASSPQAKGRIERLFGTFQDRLQTELRLARVTDRDGANTFLAHFLPRHNARFAQPPADPTPAYRPWPAKLDPQTVFCFKYQRVVSNDNTITLAPHLIQLLPEAQHRSYAKATVEIHKRLDGTLAVFHQGARIPSLRLSATRSLGRIPSRLHPDRVPGVQTPPRGGSGIATPSPQIHPGSSGKGTIQPNGSRRAQRVQQWKPAPNHPWRHMPVGKAKDKLLNRGRTKSLNS